MFKRLSNKQNEDLFKYYLKCVWIFIPLNRLVGLVVKASTSRVEDPGFESRFRRDFFGVESYQYLQYWHSSGYAARRLALQGQLWNGSARYEYTVTG